jgi:hypothetical protein
MGFLGEEDLEMEAIRVDATPRVEPIQIVDVIQSE